MSHVEQHERRLTTFCVRLKQHGFRLKRMKKSWSTFDILLNDKVRVEFKTSKFTKTVTQNGTNENYLRYSCDFNIQRHNIVKEDGCDFYVLDFHPCPFSLSGLTLIVPKDVIGKKPTVCITFRSLINKWARFSNDFGALKDFCERA